MPQKKQGGSRTFSRNWATRTIPSSRCTRSNSNRKMARTPKIKTRMEDIALITRSPIFTSRATSKKKKIMKMVTHFKSLEMNPRVRSSNRKIARKAQKSSNQSNNKISESKETIRRNYFKSLRKSFLSFPFRGNSEFFNLSIFKILDFLILCSNLLDSH